MLKLQGKKVKEGAKMLTKKTLDKIIAEYQNGGVIGNHPELTTIERKWLIRYLITKC